MQIEHEKIGYQVPRPRFQNHRQLALRVLELLVKIENTHKTNGFQSKMALLTSPADHQKG